MDQLRTLYNLSRIEVATTRARASQAGSNGFRRELLENAAAARGRVERIGQVLTGLGAAPDPVTAAVGWASTAVRTALEQVQPLDQARYLLTRAGDVPSGVRELSPTTDRRAEPHGGPRPRHRAGIGPAIAGKSPP